MNPDNSMLTSDFKSLWRLFIPEERRRYLAQLVLMTIGAILELAGIGMLVPVLAVLGRPEQIREHETGRALIEALGDPSPTLLVLLALGLLIGVNAVRVAYLAFLGWRQTDFVSRFSARLSELLYSGYLRQPYAFHLQRNSAHLIRNTTNEVNQVGATVKNYMALKIEAMTLLGIAIVLLAVNPFGVLFMSLFLGGAAWWFHRLTHSRIRDWGKRRQHHDALRMKQLHQGLGSVKEIKLLGLESLVLKEFSPHNREGSRVQQRYNFILLLPRLWLEFLVILGIGVFVVAMLLRGSPLTAVMPTLALFGAAAFRMLPSINRLMAALQGLRFGSPALHKLSSEASLMSETDLSDTPSTHGGAWFENRIEVRDLAFAYPGSPQPALDGVTLEIRKGQSVGFVGGSGAGKSTLIDILLGLLQPDKGSVTVDGVDIRLRLREWQSQIGYVPQNIYLSDETLRRNIAFGLPDRLIDENEVNRAVRMAQLDAFIKDLPLGLDTVVGERGVRLSGGQRQRIGIARALYYDPPVIVLDEATSALDNETEKDVMAAINALQGAKTLILVAHRLTTVARCDLIYRLEKGAVVDSGPPERVIDASFLDSKRVT